MPTGNRRVIALIPARGGSKGIPRKNIVPFCGRPLIVHTIETSIQTNVFDRIIVSTDDDEIADISRRHNAEVPFLRPKELSQDDTKDFAVFAHTLHWLQEHEGYTPDLVFYLRPTAPLRKVDDIYRTLEKITATNCDSVRTVCLAEHHPYRMARLVEDIPSPIMPEVKTIVPHRRQELPPIFRWNGLVDALHSRNALYYSTMFGKDIRAVITPRERSIDIDESIDLFLAECIFSSKYRDG